MALWQRWFETYMSEQVAFTLFIVYGVAALLWQGLSLITRARTYLVLASLSFFIGSLGALWSTYIQQVGFDKRIARGAQYCSWMISSR